MIFFKNEFLKMRNCEQLFNQKTLNNNYYCLSRNLIKNPKNRMHPYSQRFSSFRKSSINQMLHPSQRLSREEILTYESIFKRSEKNDTDKSVIQLNSEKEKKKQKNDQDIEIEKYLKDPTFLRQQNKMLQSFKKKEQRKPENNLIKQEPKRCLTTEKKLFPTKATEIKYNTRSIQNKYSLENAWIKTQKDRTGKGPGLIGLGNVGNSCFMNAVLQCMFNLPQFNDYFLTNKYLQDIKQTSKIVKQYAKTLKAIRQQKSRYQTAANLKKAIGSRRTKFLGVGQQDAQEFLGALLEYLSGDLNRVLKPEYRELQSDITNNTIHQISEDWWEYSRKREDSIICDFFTGQLMSRVVCLDCMVPSISFDHVWEVALNFRSNDPINLQKMIENFLREESLGANFYCANCSGFKECKRKMDFYRLPKILILQIKRFGYGKRGKVKLQNNVRIDKTINLNELRYESPNPQPQNAIYHLVGVVNHSGSISFGHYVAQCRHPKTRKWYSFNDSHVSQIRDREWFQSSTAYLLFYAHYSLVGNQ